MQDRANANDGVRLFSKAGITGAVAINSGAMIATLSQLSKLMELLTPESIAFAFISWAVGVALGSVTWLFATLAASQYANRNYKAEARSVTFVYLLVITSIGSFLFGVLKIGLGILSVGS